MKILIATTNFPRWKGDVRAPFIYELAMAMLNKSNNVRVVTVEYPGASAHENLSGLDVHRIQYYKEPRNVLQKDFAGLPAAWDRGWGERMQFAPYTLNLSKAIGKLARGYDIIHANWSLTGIATLLSMPIHNLPFVITIHGSDVFKTKNIAFVSSIVGLALRKANMVIAVSEELKKAAEGFGVNKNNIVVVSNGVNLEKFPVGALKDRRKNILFVGSLIKRKGIIYLLQAMAQIHKSDSEAKLLLVGEGDEEATLHDFVNQNGLDDSVEFLGLQSQENVAKLMREARVFVLPSVEEGQGVVLIEALASGTPCIGSRVGGIPDVITEDVGELVDPEDTEGLVIAITKFLDNDIIWLKASQNARTRAVENYDWNIIADRTLGLYKSIIEKEFTARNIN